VNCGLAEGLVHISEISWRRISHPSDVVSLDQEVTVEVLAVDKDQGKLSLGMKQLTPDPWATIDSDYEIGQEVEGTVVRIIDFGAFVLIGDDLEGLVHISEVATKRIKDLSEVLVVGDKVNVKIIKITKHDQKIGLSLKHVEQQNTELIARIDAI
jgi:ribosomal protein S1